MAHILSQQRWMIRPRPNPEAILRLFCFPYAGGASHIFRSWPHTLPTTIEVCAIELPGRGRRLQEPLFTRLSPLVKTIAQNIAPYLDKPFAFFGHSMGALLSVEMARCLRKEGGPTPAHLFVSGHRAPQLPQGRPPVYDLPEAEFIREIRRLNGTPHAILDQDELMELMLPILRADFALCDTYQYESEPPLGCPVTVFGGLGDAHIGIDDLKGWQEQTSSTCMVRMFPGDHFFLQTNQLLFLQTLARDLAQLQDRVKGKGC